MIRNARRVRINQGERPVINHKRESNIRIARSKNPFIAPLMLAIVREIIPGDFLDLIRDLIWRGLFNSTRCKGRKKRSEFLGVFFIIKKLNFRKFLQGKIQPGNINKTVAQW